MPGIAGTCVVYPLSVLYNRRFVRTLLLLLAVSVIACAQPRRDPIEYNPPPEIARKAVELRGALNALYFGGVAWDLCVLGLLLRARVGPRIRNAWASKTRSRFVERALTTATILAILWAADLPFDACRHWLGLRYGLSVHPWGPWFLDLIKASLITLIPAVLLIVAMLAAAAQWPRRWWICGWLLGVITMVAATYLAPLLFDPLFFEFKSLAATNPSLTTGLQKVASHAGFDVPQSRIYEMDASRKTRATNAYMTGFGDSRRIVIWDTSIQALTPPQVETVFAHELGHYALNHIPISIAIGAAGLFAALWLLHAALSRAIRGERFGILGLQDSGGLPLFFLATLIVSFASEPLGNAYSRWQEHQADIYELEAMHGLVPEAGRNSAEVTRKMAELDLEDPNPSAFIRFWRYSHPPSRERIRFAQRYDPWAQGARPKYLR